MPERLHSERFHDFEDPKLFAKALSASMINAAAKLDLGKSTVPPIKLNDLIIHTFSKLSAQEYFIDQEKCTTKGYRKAKNKLIINGGSYMAADLNDVSDKLYFNVYKNTDVKYADRVKHKTKFFEAYFLIRGLLVKNATFTMLSFIVRSNLS